MSAPLGRGPNAKGEAAGGGATGRLPVGVQGDAPGASPDVGWQSWCRGRQARSECRLQQAEGGLRMKGGGTAATSASAVARDEVRTEATLGVERRRWRSTLLRVGRRTKGVGGGRRRAAERSRGLVAPRRRFGGACVVADRRLVAAAAAARAAAAAAEAVAGGASSRARQWADETTGGRGRGGGGGGGGGGGRQRRGAAPRARRRGGARGAIVGQGGR